MLAARKLEPMLHQRIDYLGLEDLGAKDMTQTFKIALRLLCPYEALHEKSERSSIRNIIHYP